MIYRTTLLPTPFSQRDPRWADIPIGTSRTTMGRAGCTITSAASCLSALGVDTDPGRLNRYLTIHQGFVSSNLMRFNAFGPLGVSCFEVIECANRPAPVEHIADAIAAGHTVIALVDFSPGGTVNQHWVRLLSLDDDEAQIMDPWNPPPDPVYYLMARYAAPTWITPARALFRVVIYCRGESPGHLTFDDDLTPHAASAPTATQRRLCRRRRRWW